MKNFVKVILIILIIIIGFFIIQANNFNGFKLAHYYEGKTKVNRDNKEKYNGEWSYKIESEDYNDFMVFKTINVKKNTSYKVSCMVKTKDIESQENGKSGFNICLKDNLEKSQSIFGTNDWTNLTFYFNSYNNETIDIVFRLGGNNDNCKGTAWFSNINIESGRKKTENNWKIAVFMINNTNAEINDKKISEQLTGSQASTIKNSLVSFKNTMKDFSNNNINIDYDFFSIDEPLKNVSYSEDTGYYVAAKDAYELINKTIYEKENYDHIFVVTNIGDIINGDKIEWLGLGGMVYNNIGYSNIRISDETIKSYRSSIYNYFPEEIGLHEFLHTLERNSKLLGYDTIALHDYAKYGYKSEARYGLKEWYQDYIQKRINNNLGLEEDVYYTQPVSEKNFIKKENITKEVYDKQNIIQKISEKVSKIV